MPELPEVETIRLQFQRFSKERFVKEMLEFTKFHAQKKNKVK